jgi:hypothetical protein
MSFARASAPWLLFVVLCLCAPAAFAQFCGAQVCEPEEPADGDPCPYMTAEECFWGAGGGFNPPTTTACIAFKRSNQICKECMPAHDEKTGNPKGYDFCANVTRSAACSCENAGTPNCKDKGACNYR